MQQRVRRMSGLEPIRLSTDDLPRFNRQEAIREYFGRMLQHMDYATNDERGMWIKAEAWLLSGVILGRSTYSPLEIERTPSLLQDGRDDVMLCCLPSGGRVSLPDGTDIEVKPGDFMLAALDYPLRLRLPETGRDATRMVQLARTSLDGLANPFDEAPLRTIPADRPELRLLASYAHAVTQNSLPSMAVRQTVSQHLIDLATLVIGATREAQAIASHRGSRAAQLAFAKAEILRRLAEPDLNVASVAYRLRISPRYLHMLFEQEHMTFSAFVTSRRLARARDMLVRPSHASRRIIDIALDAGFREIRTFNRSFRERYGMSPSECRAQANRLI